MKLPELAVKERLSDLISNRVYPLRAPDNMTDDFIVYQRVGAERYRSINAPSGLVQATIQVDCYSKSYYNVKSLQLAVESRLDGFRGVVSYGSSSPQESVRIGGISLISENELIDTEDEPVLYRVTMSFLITYDQE